MISHVSTEGDAKRKGDEELTRAWKEHNTNCRMMDHKVDLIVSFLGIQFFNLGRPNVEAGGSSLKLRQKGDLKQVVFEATNMIKSTELTDAERTGTGGHSKKTL